MRILQRLLILSFLSLAALLMASYEVQASAPSCNQVYSTPKAKRIQRSEELKQVLEDLNTTAAKFQGTKKFTSPKAWRADSAKYGLPGLDLPKELGGKDLPASDMIQVFEQAGKLALDLRDVVGGGHVRPLANSSVPEVQEIVRQVAKGKAYISIAITEESAGSNMRAMRSYSEKTEGGYLVSGSKFYNARFTTASHVILFTQASAKADGKLNAFILPIDHPGLKFETIGARGLKGNSFGGVSFDKMFIPEKYRLGKDGDGGKVFRKHFLYWRLMMAAAAVGTGKGALEQVAQRLRERQAFGGPIGRFTHLQQPLAEHTAKLHMATLLIQQAAKLIDQGKYEEAKPLVAMAKGEGVEFALAASDYAMKVFGAEGYSDRTDLGQRVNDLMGLRIADGTTDVMRQEVVRQVYGNDLWDLAIGTGEQ